MGCGANQICYAHSAAEIEERIDSGECEAVYVYDVVEETLQFRNADPAVTVFINDVDNPAVHRIEADGLGRVTTSLIDEVVRTNTDCRGGMSGAKLLEMTIGPNRDGGPGTCALFADAGISVRLAAEDGVIVDFIYASSNDWSTVTLDVNESAQPTGTFYAGGTPLDVLQKFGSGTNDVELSGVSDDTQASYFSWLDSEGYDGTVHVVSDDGTGRTYVQVYPPVSE